MNAFCTVLVTWRGATINETPLMVYHDEISAFSGDDTLECRSDTFSQGWYFPNGNSVNFFTSDISGFQQFVIGPTAVLHRNPNVPLTANTSLNGLWSCRAFGAENGAIPVGIYSRGGG